MPNYTPVDHLLKKHQEAVSLHKEAEPFAPRQVENYQIQEVVEHEPPQEVKDHVDVRKETVKLSDDLKKMGIQAVDTTKFPSFQSIKLPISDEKVYNGLHAPVYSSLRWLATFALYLLQQSHVTLKQVHGKVIRIIKR
jgi:hypothetical protein